MLSKFSCLAIVPLIGVALAACAPASTVVKTYEDPQYVDTTVSRVLVIARAGSYDNRSEFERELTKRLVSAGASATAYYTIKGNSPLLRDEVVETVRSGGYDSVLFTRELDTNIDVKMEQGSSTMTSTRKQGSAVNLFRYDYEEYADPASPNLSASTSLSTELYLASSETRIWAIDSSLATKNNVHEIIAAAVDEIVGQLVKDHRISAVGN